MKYDQTTGEYERVEVPSAYSKDYKNVTNRESPDKMDASLHRRKTFNPNSIAGLYKQALQHIEDSTTFHTKLEDYRSTNPHSSQLNPLRP